MKESDAMVAYAIKSKGGFIWACKNQDGDVNANLVAQGFGSPGLMTSMLQCPDGTVLSEIAHGTNTKYYNAHMKGEETSVNSIACMFAWTQALLAIATMEDNTQLRDFSELLEGV